MGVLKFLSFLILEYVTIVVSFAPGDWTGADVDVSIHSIPHTYFYVIAIKAVTDGVTVGGTVNTLNGRQQVFSMVNIIIVRYGECLDSTAIIYI